MHTHIKTSLPNLLKFSLIKNTYIYSTNPNSQVSPCIQPSQLDFLASSYYYKPFFIPKKIHYTIMATEEIYPNPKLQEDNDFDDHEYEETLSLCDLPISTDQDHYEDDSCKKLHQSSSISSSVSLPFSSDEQDFFEFFSEEWNIKASPTFNKTHPPPSENIIFCGKMIPSHPRNQEAISKSTQKLKTKNIISHSQEKRSLGKSRSSVSKGSDKNMNEVLVPRESIFTSLVKKRWYLILLGLPPKIPTDQKELMTDIKNRQSRHAPSTFFPSDGGGAEAKVRRKNDYGSWRLIKAASCFGGQLMQTSVL